MFENIRNAMAELTPRAIELTDKTSAVAEQYFPRAVRAPIEAMVMLKLTKMTRQKPTTSAIIAVLSPLACKLVAGRVADWLINHVLDIDKFIPFDNARAS